MTAPPLNAPPLAAPAANATLIVLFDGACPLCRREINHVRALAQRQPDSALSFIDIGCDGEGEGESAVAACERPALRARFHVQRADGSRLDGAAAFVEMWRRLPGWRWLARLAQVPGMPMLMEAAYRGFLQIRPALQALARRIEAAAPATSAATSLAQSPAQSPAISSIPSTTSAADTEPQPARASSARLSPHWVRELRSDHAGETGAVFIYQGLAAVAAWRHDAELIAFARRHGHTETEHLRLIEAWLPPPQRSRLLRPWRLAGWLTGALPALAGRRAVYATIAAVETFVDRHYQAQIDHLQRHGGPDGLAPLLQRCQADECDHRDEAAALAGAHRPLPLRLWCALVGGGSATAVALARRI